MAAALWVVIVLTVAAIAAARYSVTEHRLAAYQWEAVRLREGLRAAVDFAIRDVGAMDSPGWDAYNQAWANAPKLFTGRSFPGGRFDVTNDADGQRLSGCADESGKIDLNRAPPDVLERVFGDRGDVAAAVLDWRDPDDVRRFHGAEAADYPDTKPRNGPFQSVDELLLVRGVSPDVFETVRPLLTVAGGATVNANTASLAVLRCLGLPDRARAVLQKYREGPDGRRGTADDGIFRAVGDLPAVLTGPWSKAEAAALADLWKRNLLGVRSRAISLTMEVAMTDGLEGGVRVVALPRAWPPRIVEWREDPW